MPSASVSEVLVAWVPASVLARFQGQGSGRHAAPEWRVKHSSGTIGRQRITSRLLAATGNFRLELQVGIRATDNDAFEGPPDSEAR